MKITLKAFKLPQYFAINTETEEEFSNHTSISILSIGKKKLQCKRNGNFSQHFSSAHAPTFFTE